jgi:hypothetical protein
VWQEEFNLPLRATPTAIVLRVFDRDFSNDSEVAPSPFSSVERETRLGLDS